MFLKGAYTDEPEILIYVSAFTAAYFGHHYLRVPCSRCGSRDEVCRKVYGRLLTEIARHGCHVVELRKLDIDLHPT